MQPSIKRPGVQGLKLIFLLGFMLWYHLPARAQAAGNLTDSIDNLLASWQSELAPGISVAAVKDGRIVYNQSFGMANIENKVASDSLTKYWIASVSKQFTAAAIYLLASQKKLTINRSIRAYLTELPLVFQDVTVDHLIHHTSGIRDGFVLTALAKKPESEYTNENVLRYLQAQKNLNFGPGSSYEYNNSGYVLLAILIERISQISYPEYMKANIFDPLEMSDTYVAGSFPTGKYQAEGYHSEGSNIFRAGHFHGNTYGSTGIITTVSDLVRWSKFLDEQMTAPSLSSIRKNLLQVGKLINGRPISYSGGLEKFEYQGQAVYEHFGSDEGFKADMLYFPGTHLSVIGMTNNGSYYDLQRLLYRISDLVLAKANKEYKTNSSDTIIRSEKYYYDAYTTQLLRVQHFETHVKVANTPSGYAAPYQIVGDTLQSLDPVPNLLVQQRGVILVIDSYYHKTVRLEEVRPVTTTDDLAALTGEYFSEELQVSYRIINTENGLQLEFVPGMAFDLFRITKTDFMFEHAGPNVLHFTNEGLEFSREGCRKLFFQKKN